MRSMIAGVGIAVLGLAALASPSSAQLARMPAAPDAPKLLVAPFGRDQAADSGIAALVGDAVRARMIDAHTDNFQTITRKAVCDFLEESGFTCSTQLEPSQVGQLAHVMNARYMVDGMIFPRGTDSVLVLARMLQTVRQNPLAISVSLVVPRDKANAAVGNALADRLADKFHSFDNIMNCRAAVEAKDFNKAADEANRALRSDHESAGAYLCLAQLAQARGEPTDSVQAALERAHDADSLNTIVGRQLYIIYQDKHDTAQMLHMLRHIMEVDVNDVDIRKVAVQLEVLRGHPDSAVMLLDAALNRNPNQFDFLVLKAISLGAEGKYADAGTSMAAAAALDSTKIDSLFLARTLAFYDAAKDSATAFTWRKICTVKTPNDADCWFLYASGLYDRHDTTGAMDAIRHLIAIRPQTGRGQMVIANWFGVAAAADSAAADSAHALVLFDSSLAEARAAVAADTTWRPQAASMFLRAGYTSFRAKDYPRTIELLTPALPWAADPNKATIAYLLGNSQFYIGLAALQQLQVHPAMKTNHPPAAQVAEACGLVKTIGDNFDPAQTNIAAGASVSRDAANQMLTYIGNVMPALAQIRTRLKCAP